MKLKEPYTIGVKTMKEILMCEMTEDEKDAYIKHLQTEIVETKKRLSDTMTLIKNSMHILKTDVYKNVYKNDAKP
jgi:hypothetical protein|tara:strand:- start:703 stop:927 length:225 start_codon:yes stop_codon:yes gene_type:complete